MRYAALLAASFALSMTGFAGDVRVGPAPLLFIENRGQLPEEAAFYVQGRDKVLYFTPRGVTFALSSSWILKQDFLGSDPNAKPEGEGRRKAAVSCFKGKPEDWVTGIPAYAGLVYRDLWPGIDLVYSGFAGGLKYEFRVKPGADPEAIRLALRGAEGVRLKKSGRLEISFPLGAIEDEKPLAWQNVDGKRRDVAAAYALEPERRDGTFIYGFQVGDYDPRELLIIDPALLIYCGYLGGTLSDIGSGVTVDGEGNAYLTGWTKSPPSSFPVHAGPDPTYNGGEFDAFVAKVSADGADLLYCGYIGGANIDLGVGVAVDDEGSAYVAGLTNSKESSFPVFKGPDLTFNGVVDVFVAKVSPDGTKLAYCGYLGGSGFEGDKDNIWGGVDIEADGAGCAYVAGFTESSEKTFPVSIGPDLTYNGRVDAFVAKVIPNGSKLAYCGYIGGADEDLGVGLAVDPSGGVCVAGYTESDEASFPVVLGPDLSYNGGGDAFIARVSPDGGSLLFCGYVGGSDVEAGYDAGVDTKGRVYLTGWTYSNEQTFPAVTGPDLTYNGGGRDAFAARVSPDGSKLEYCGYIGGGGSDYGLALAVDAWGGCCITGGTSSPEASFPVSVGPDLSHNGGTDAFIARVHPDGTFLEHCGYIGGAGTDCGWEIGLDAFGRLYVVGKTDSEEATFPVTGGPDLTHNGGEDAFIARMTRGLECDACTLSQSTGGAVNFLLEAGKANANRGYLLLGSASGTEPGTTLPGGGTVLPINWDGVTLLMLSLVNTPFLKDFLGSLDASGSAAARLDTLGPLPPGIAGTVIHLAYALNNPWDFASNPVALEVVP